MSKVEHLLSALKPLGRIAIDRFEAEGVEANWAVRSELARWNRHFCQDIVQSGFVRLSREQPMARNAFIEHGAQGEQIGSPVEILAHQPLGGQVGNAAFGTLYLWLQDARTRAAVV